jgi:hypothetical protein
VIERRFDHRFVREIAFVFDVGMEMDAFEHDRKYREFRDSGSAFRPFC